MSNDNKKASNHFAYDDAFRTMEAECDDIFIPFVNHVFEQNYTSKAIIKRKRNDHYIPNGNGGLAKKYTDSYVEIIEDGKEKRYHFECESKGYDKTLLVRFFQYDSFIASDERIFKDKYNLTVRYPRSGLLVLRSNGNPPETATITIETDGGNVTYPIKVIKVSDYSIEEIFDKHLFLLIPFYIFNYEKELKHYEKNEKVMESLAKKYESILDKLNDAHQRGLLSALSYGVIISMIERVITRLTNGKGSFQGKVGAIMGGKVLDLPEIRAYHQGKDEGLAEGLAERKSLEDEVERLRKELEELKKKA